METLISDSVRLRTELREALKELHQKLRRGWKSDQFYRLDRHDAYDYFGDLPEWGRKIYQYLRSLREQGEYVTYVDICGRARATSLGAHENYSFSLQPISSYDTLGKEVGSNGEDPRFRGDLFCTRDFNRFLAMIRRNESRPAFVTFEPVAALQSYIPFQGALDHPRMNRKVAFQILQRHLRRLVGILRPGGYILLGPPFQFENIADFFARKPQSQYESSLYVKALCRKLTCSVETAATLNGPRWLIRKPEIKAAA